MTIQDIRRQIHISQGGRCFECAIPMKLENSTKRRNSFRLICQECYSISKEAYIIIDDPEERNGEA